jgi:hypothetical protein
MGTIMQEEDNYFAPYNMFRNKILLTDFQVDINSEYHYTCLIYLKIRQVQIL